MLYPVEEVKMELLFMIAKRMGGQVMKGTCKECSHSGNPVNHVDLDSIPKIAIKVVGNDLSSLFQLNPIITYDDYLFPQINFLTNLLTASLITRKVKFTLNDLASTMRLHATADEIVKEAHEHIEDTKAFLRNEMIESKTGYDFSNIFTEIEQVHAFEKYLNLTKADKARIYTNTGIEFFIPDDAKDIFIF